jgi:hypothetical protein
MHVLPERPVFHAVPYSTRIPQYSIPTPSIKVLRLVLAGLIPRQTIWEYNATMAGGYNAYVKNLMGMFPPDPNGSVHPLDVIRDVLLQCSSINEARRILSERESRVTG